MTTIESRLAEIEARARESLCDYNEACDCGLCSSITEKIRLVVALRLALEGLDHCDFMADDAGAGLGEEYKKKIERLLKEE